MLIETLKLWDDRDDVELTTFLHLPDKFIPNPVKKPAVIVCPGGAYQRCPRHGNEGDPVAMAFAMDGYQAFVLEYSVAERAPEGKTLFPAQIIDFGKAILTIREHAEEWSIDTEKISIIGFSAGAHLCGMLATTWHKPLLKEYFGVESADIFRPMAAMLIYGVLDYIVQEDYRKVKPSPMLGDVNTAVFGCADPDAEQLKAYSPAYQVSEFTPPVFLAAAVDDGMVSAMSSLRMTEQLQKLERPYELHMFEYGDHGFSLGRHLFEPFREDMAHACSKWLPMAKTFLMHQISEESTKYEKSVFAAMGDMLN